LLELLTFESVLYGVTTVACSGLTLGLATVTIGLAMTGVGIPLALVTGVMTYGTYGATVYCGSKTQHKVRVSCGSNKHCHSGAHALKAMAGIKK
jgi:hypothetical protein